MKYTVQFVLDATENVEVEAENVDDAIAKAAKRRSGGLCHACATEIDVGDVQWCQVLGEGGKVVYTEQERIPGQSELDEANARAAYWQLKYWCLKTLDQSFNEYTRDRAKSVRLRDDARETEKLAGECGLYMKERGWKP